MSTLPTPPLPPKGDQILGGTPDEPVVEVDGEVVLDPDADPDLIDSADADRIAASGDDA